MFEIDETKYGYILLGDCHAGLNGTLSYHDHNIKEILFKSVSLTDKPCDSIIFMGDIFDNRKAPHTTVVDFMVETIDEFLSMYKEYHIYMIIGNHDTYWKNTNKVHSLRHFDRCFHRDRIHIIEEPLESNNMLFIPWICEDNMDSIMETVKNSKMEYCLGHLEFSGFKQTKDGKVLSHGMSFEPFNHFKMILSGHFHHSSKKGNVLYTGSLQQHNKDEKNDYKKIFYLNPHTHEIDEIEHGINIMIDLEVGLDFIPVGCKDKRVFLKVLEGVNDVMLENFKEQIRQYEPISITVYENKNIIKEDIDVSVTLENVKDTMNIISDYVSNIKDINIDNNILMKKINNYYNMVV